MKETVHCVTKEQIEHAKHLDLLTYLQTYETGELVRVSPGIYSTREHDSLKISNGKWCWWSKNIGGKTALDYLIKVKGMEFMDAVLLLCNDKRVLTSHTASYLKAEGTPFELPMAYANNDRVERYLLNRGIEHQIIDYCINTNKLYEDNRHNCVFIGCACDTPKYAMLRSTLNNSTFLGEVKGSDKMYSFSLSLNRGTDILFVFESAIDLLSYISLDMLRGNKKLFNYLSLSGVYRPGRDSPHLPVSLEHYLSENKHIRQIVLCLDNDEAGKLASDAIFKLLPKVYNLQDMPPPEGKDYNDYLMVYKKLNKRVKTRGAKSAPNYYKEDLLK